MPYRPRPIGEHGENLSIMIPTYNCAKYLARTLESLKEQGAVISHAQIEVVDDYSNEDNPESIVDDCSLGRVAYYRQPFNTGLVKNFNTCIERAKNEWVHILHGDDFVIQNAYNEFKKCNHIYPDATAIYSRAVYVNKDGFWIGISPVISKSMRGILEYTPERWSFNFVEFASVLVTKYSYEKIGGFCSEFCHAADWNAWWSVARNQNVAFSNACTGAYRIFEGNHSSSIRRNAGNIKEYVQQINAIVDYEKSNGIKACFDPDPLYSQVFEYTIKQCGQYVGDVAAFKAHMRILKHIPKQVKKRRALLHLMLRHIFHLRMRLR